MDPKSHPQYQRSRATPQRRPASSANHARQREAALSMVRSEIDSLYGGTSATQPTSQQPHQQQPTATLPPKAAAQAARPTMSPQDTEAERWRKYHSAWQEYYRKYYEQYYVSEVKKSVAQQAPATSAAPQVRAQQTQTTTVPPREDGAITQNEAMSELRQNIIKSAQESATKVRRSKHFIPIFAAILVVATVALLQYNQVLVAHVKAYMSPGNIEPQNIIVNPNANVPVGPEPKMIIPKINVDAPVVMNVGPTQGEQLAAMADGIAHVRYPGASAEPGQVGNSVFSAHSSSDWTDTGAYKFIFVQLERLAVDDVIYINYNSKRYSYKVYKREVVEPTNVDALKYTGDKPVITLITCVPLGTADKRLLIHAEQVSPDPSGAPKADPKKAPASDESASTQMTGTSPTLIERLFGAR
ncbi:MAG: sortase [Candidatus Saccharimonadales bacterium]